MEQIQNLNNSSIPKELFQKSLTRYKIFMLIRVSLIIAALLAVFGIVSLVYWNNIVGWVLLASALLLLTCYWIYSTIKINPTVNKMSKELETYKPYFKEYYAQLSKLNQFIFRFFFLVELYDQAQAVKLLDNNFANQDIDQDN
ncbi:hypothetical protein [Mycoplasma sp. 005V]|uniref:hypothetical protein n=1 Tax=unclassified Mycoplasma TaxID=2683645 RepID=UPI003A8842CB